MFWEFTGRLTSSVLEDEGPTWTHGLLVLVSEEATWSPPTPLTSEKILQSDHGQLGVTFPPGNKSPQPGESVLPEQAGSHPRRADRGEEQGAVCLISDHR